MSSERQRGTLEMLLSSPLSLWVLILGKWFSTLVLCFILIAMCMFFPLLLSFYAVVDWGGATLSGKCLLVLHGVFLFGALGNSFSRPRIKCHRWCICSVASVALWCCSTFYRRGNIGNTLSRLSFSYHLSRMSLGIVDISDIFWFFGAASLFPAIHFYVCLPTTGGHREKVAC